jgi:hypothetical protein
MCEATSIKKQELEAGLADGPYIGGRIFDSIK